MRTPAGLAAACLAVIAAMTFATATTEEAKLLGRGQLVGVWRLCYEPGLPGVSELNTSYLIILPDDRYVRMADMVDSPRMVETGTYKVQSEGIVLQGTTRQAPDGKPAGGPVFAPWTLRYEEQRSVVFGTVDKDSPTKAAVLLGGASANYGFAKIF